MIETARRLLELSQAATPGPWHLMKDGFGKKPGYPTIYATDDDLRYIAKFADGICFHSETDNLANATHTAACDPTTIAALMTCYLKMHKALEKIESIQDWRNDKAAEIALEALKEVE